MPTCFLVGAYGRKYLSVHKMLEDWNAGIDFQIVGGPYCSIRDIEMLKQEFSAIALLTRGQHMYIWEAWRNL